MTTEVNFDAILAHARATGQNIDQVLSDLEALVDYRRFNMLEFFQPYEKQWEFIALGKTKKERGLFAGNQFGKSHIGAYEAACHLTGRYPSGWNGKTFNRPIQMWAAGTSTTAVRDVSQTKLFGPPGVAEEQGTGFIPRDCIISVKNRRNAGADVIESAVIRHYANGVEDGISTVGFKTYEQGREEFQGKTLDVYWGDEESGPDIYSEAMARLTAHADAIAYTTFTPLKGRTDLVLKLYDAPHDSPYGSIRVRMADVPFLEEGAEEAAKARYPRHEWEARINGVPMLGEGREFIVPREQIAWKPPTRDNIPLHWRKLWAIDFGISHPFAAVLMLWDAETDIFYVYRTYRATGAIPSIHAAAMREIASEPPVAWPHDGWARDKGSGDVLAKQYKNFGLKMMPTHAHFAGGGYSTEAAITEMHQRIAASKFRVNEECTDWFEEYEEYHRKDGQLVKVRDDLLSATQKGIMMRRHARPVELHGTSLSFNAGKSILARPRQAPPVNPWTGRPVYG